MFESIDPSTEESYRRVELDSPAAVEAKLQAARDAFSDWSARPIAERAELVTKFAKSLREDRERLAEYMTMEMGKPIREALGEADKCALCFEYYAGHAEGYLAPRDLPSDAAHSYVQHLPLGTVFGILPWNAPFWLASRVAAPALMAGNTVIIKHDPHVPACAEGLAEHAEKILPPGVLQVAFTDADGAEKILRDSRTHALSFTGSPKAGRAVAGIAASELKPAVLELGGSDPAIVLADADIEAAVNTLTTSRMINAGQSCIAAKRILVEESIYEDFTARMKARIEGLKMGPPGAPETDIGPIARADLRDNLHRQVEETVKAGARCLTGGAMPEGPGFFYPPTLLVDVPTESAAFCEETFGPVAAVSPVKDAEQAVAIANDSEYGLAGSVWTDAARGEEIARRMETGQVAVNGLVKTDPRLPSGGIKNSGYGRELGPHGILEFVNIQQVWVGPAKPA